MYLVTPRNTKSNTNVHLRGLSMEKGIVLLSANGTLSMLKRVADLGHTAK